MNTNFSPDERQLWAGRVHESRCEHVLCLHHSCKLGRDLKGPRWRDVEGTRSSRSRRGPPRDATQGESVPARRRRAQSQTDRQTHTHERARALPGLRRVLGGPAAAPSAEPEGTREAGLQPECGEGFGAVGPPRGGGVWAHLPQAGGQRGPRIRPHRLDPSSGPLPRSGSLFHG